jgi:hypothetical protein
MMHMYVDVSLGWQLNPVMKATRGIRNLTALRPPSVYPIYMDATIYDQVGLLLFASVAVDL